MASTADCAEVAMRLHDRRVVVAHLVRRVGHYDAALLVAEPGIGSGLDGAAPHAANSSSQICELAIFPRHREPFDGPRTALTLCYGNRLDQSTHVSTPACRCRRGSPGWRLQG